MKVFKMLINEKNISFFLAHDFIYYKNKENERNYLCICKLLKKFIF